MNNDMYKPVDESNDFGRFTNFFIKYLKGSFTHDEAFVRTSYIYRRLFKKIPYRTSRAFLNEFFRTQHIN